MRGSVCVWGAPVYRCAHTISTLGNMKILDILAELKNAKFSSGLKKNFFLNLLVLKFS